MSKNKKKPQSLIQDTGMRGLPIEQVSDLHYIYSPYAQDDITIELPTEKAKWVANTLKEYERVEKYLREEFKKKRRV